MTPSVAPGRHANESGQGKRNGREAVRAYSRLKSVVIDFSGRTRDPS